MSNYGPTPLPIMVKLLRRSAPDGGCLIWTGGTDKGGYGKVWHDGRSMRAHRAAWIAAHGDVPDGLLVLHRCDNPPCFLVEHLYLGTAKQNQQDRAERTGWDGVGPKVKTHCRRGHPYQGHKNSRGHNLCLVCIKGDAEC